MKKFVFAEPGDDGKTPIFYEYTRQEILDEYFDYWKNGIIKVKGQEFFDSIEWKEKCCIIDWVVVHWAEPIEELNID